MIDCSYIKQSLDEVFMYVCVSLSTIVLNSRD